jgi:hypothetical protein
MRPLLFRWKSVTIWSYPALLNIGAWSVGALARAVGGVSARQPLAARLSRVILSASPATDNVELRD